MAVLRRAHAASVDFPDVNPVEYQEERRMGALGKADIVRGTLDLLVLKTLDTLGPLHGYGIAQRIVQVSESMLSLNQGTLYPALLRLEQRGWVQSRMGTSDNNRHARFYSLTAAGRRQLKQETDDWVRASGVVNRILRTSE
jgi:transcriptional regulator